MTPARLTDPDSAAILSRKKRLIKYIWFRVELREYDCNSCDPEEEEYWGLSRADDKLIMDGFENLLWALIAWEDGDELTLDISVYSPSDTQHWFKYLSFHPDTHRGECSPLQRNGHYQGTPIDDPDHGWVAGRQTSTPDWYAVDILFERIMGQGPFRTETQEKNWWQTLPLVPAVTTVLLRQQTRRRWKPVTLKHMLERFPNMKELCYEPWREWDRELVRLTNIESESLVEMFATTRLSNLAIFENFHRSYPPSWINQFARRPSPVVSRKIAKVSLKLVTLSACFITDASYFFEAREESWNWENLTSLALTSKLLTHDVDAASINEMLRLAAEAALHMPKLEVMELWNGRERVAMLFRYQKAKNGQSAVITVRGTFQLALDPEVIEAWNAVATQLGHGWVDIQSSIINPNTIRSHGDAIRQLGLSTQVVRPVSLQQILDEHEDRA
ncbi:hypothetical protein CkaCkLH20_12892 [Colletotrichum karsti]|uniref:DUF6546 domain-containing protein n=1 Tax=Colletotrichum karsti TaxID=1095194 RepID=A0A9P6LEI9_9PEZI|nr:uncharacterized protein CkaCkLH20_12892 [Colletotrichum karsti]KAF9869595.1 hypothetical protein CkaCkLH20_12892 [Colletotrichum karsti]